MVIRRVAFTRKVLTGSINKGSFSKEEKVVLIFSVPRLSQQNLWYQRLEVARSVVMGNTEA
jgi:hypothetical protein